MENEQKMNEMSKLVEASFHSRVGTSNERAYQVLLMNWWKSKFAMRVEKKGMTKWRLDAILKAVEEP